MFRPRHNNLSSVPFHNLATGVIEVTAGALGFGSDGTWDSANFLISTAASVRLEGGTKTWTGTYTGTGPGTLTFTGGTIVAGAAGATLNFPAGFFTITNDSNINGTTFTNTGTITVNGDPNFRATINNTGTIFNDARFDFVTTGQVNNLPGGVFEITSAGDGGSFGNFSGPGFFNSGIFRHSGTGDNNLSSCRRRNKTGKVAGTKVDSGLQSKSG